MPNSPRREETPFQMAPMIDMVFLLLVFFMTVSTLARDARPEVTLPDSSTARVPAEVPPREVISVRERSGEDRVQYFLGSRAVTLTEIGDWLDSMPDPSSRTFLLRGPGGLPYHRWEPILDLCRAAGTGDLCFATFEE
ncbi:MAG: hypothetical protein GVY10_06340 [Verrucomicrobia bacterium]|jgi:biopolymer transport protein ExbD|nr:hypothetical protein [Verrucomicrobiota bacterium]